MNKSRCLTETLLVVLVVFVGAPALGQAKQPAAYLAFDDVFDHDNPAESEKRLRELAVQADAARNREVEAEILTQVARSEGLEKKFREAHADLDRANALAGSDRRVVIRTLIERGRLYRLAGDTAKARLCFEDGFEAARADHQDYLMLDAVHMIALNEPFEVSQAWVRRGLRMAAHSRDPRTLHWVAILNNNMGVAYLDRRNYTAAIRAFTAALAAYRAQHADQETLKGAQDALLQAQNASQTH